MTSLRKQRENYVLDLASEMQPLKEHTSTSRTQDPTEKSIFNGKKLRWAHQFSLLWSVASQHLGVSPVLHAEEKESIKRQIHSSCNHSLQPCNERRVTPESPAFSPSCRNLLLEDGQQSNVLLHTASKNPVKWTISDGESSRHRYLSAVATKRTLRACQ